jgi:hypothetical protein
MVGEGGVGSGMLHKPVHLSILVHSGLQTKRWDAGSEKKWDIK